MNWGFCPECKEYVVLGSHHCLPIWRVRLEGYLSEDADKVRALDAEDAAAACMGKIHLDLDIDEGERITILVAPAGSENWEAYDVWFERATRYFAEKHS